MTWISSSEATNWRTRQLDYAGSVVCDTTVSKPLQAPRLLVDLLNMCLHWRVVFASPLFSQTKRSLFAAIKHHSGVFSIVLIGLYHISIYTNLIVCSSSVFQCGLWRPCWINFLLMHSKAFLLVKTIQYFGVMMQFNSVSIASSFLCACTFLSFKEGDHRPNAWKKARHSLKAVLRLVCVHSYVRMHSSLHTYIMFSLYYQVCAQPPTPCLSHSVPL